MCVSVNIINACTLNTLRECDRIWKNYDVNTKHKFCRNFVAYLLVCCGFCLAFAGCLQVSLTRPSMSLHSPRYVRVRAWVHASKNHQSMNKPSFCSPSSHNTSARAQARVCVRDCSDGGDQIGSIIVWALNINFVSYLNCWCGFRLRLLCAVCLKRIFASVYVRMYVCMYVCICKSTYAVCVYSYPCECACVRACEQCI